MHCCSGTQLTSHVDNVLQLVLLYIILIPNPYSTLVGFENFHDISKWNNIYSLLFTVVYVC